MIVSRTRVGTAFCLPVLVRLRDFIRFSSDQAAQHTFGDWLVDTILDGLAGGVSGMGSSVVYGGINKGKTAIAYTGLGANVIDNQTVNNVISVAETLPQTSEAYKLAQAIKEGTKKNNAYNVGRLLQMTMNATGNAASVLEEQFTEDVQRRLEQKGETENTEAVARAAAQLLMTGQVTAEQAQVLAESKHGIEVLNEASQAQENHERLAEARKTSQRMATIAEAAQGKDSETGNNSTEGRTGTEERTAEEGTSTEGRNRTEGRTSAEGTMDSTERETISQAQAEDKTTGEKVEVQGISQTSRTGTATVTVTKGGTVQQVNLEDVSFDNDRQATAYRMAAQMETPTKGQAFLDVLKKTTMPVDTARAAFNSIYNAGMRGLNLDASTITTRYAELLGTDATLAAYEYGAKEQARQNERLSFAEDVTQTLKDTIAALPDSVDESYTGVVYKASKKSQLSASMAAQVEVLNEVAKRYMLQVEVVDQAGEGSMKGKINGQYIRGTNRIQVALDSDQGLLTATLAHEMTHFIKAWNLEGYVDLANFIGSKLGQTDGYNLQERIEQKIEQYKQSGVELTEEGAVEEIVADSMFTVFENEQYVHDLFEQHESLGEKIASRLKNFVQELKQLAKNLKSPEARAMAKQEAETVDKLAKMFNDAATMAMAQRFNQTMQEKMENAPVNEKFQMKEEVERVGDLIAVHNMDSGYLETVLENGGIIAPSIAVRLAKTGWSEYGNVSLIYDASVIDPEASEWNNVFNDDAFTQVTPRSYYRVNVEELRSLLQQVERYAEDMSADRVDGLKYDIETLLRHAQANADSKTGESYLIRDDYSGLKTIVNQLSNAAIQEYGSEGIADAGERAQARNQWAETRMGELSDGEESYRIETMQEVEEQAAQDDDSFDDDDWFDDEYKPKKKQKAKKKVKSFEYMPASEENALKVNRSESVRNAESGTGGYYQEGAALTHRFTSLDDIREQKYQLDPDDETSDQRWRASTAARNALRNVAAEAYRAASKKDKTLLPKNVSNTVYKLAGDRMSRTEMVETFRDLGLSDAQAEGFADRVLDAIEQGENAHFSNAGMFEAKPIRRVENKGGIRAAVVPEGYWANNPNAARMAAEQGIQMLEYNGTDADRTRVMNSELLADVRFSLKEEVEQVKDLIAVHNRSIDALIRDIKRGGMAAPSIAVTKTKFNYDNFGNVSILFDKNSIDPQANENNRLYCADAWTPREPSLERKAEYDPKGIRKVNRWMLAADAYENEFPDGLEQVISDWGNPGPEKLAERLSATESAQEAFVDKNGTEEERGAALDGELWRVKNVRERTLQWLKSELENIVTTSTIDVINENGERESKPYTIENIVKEMFKEGKKRSVGANFGRDLGYIAAPEYRTLDELKADSNRFNERTTLEWFEVTEQMETEAKELTLKVAQENGMSLRNITDSTKVNDALIEAAWEREKTAENVKKVLAKNGMTITEETAEKLSNLLKRAAADDVTYMESKPERGVYTDEWGLVVLPANAERSAEAMRDMDNAGINYVTYDGTKADRIRVINEEARKRDLVFSLKEDTGVLASLQGVDKINENMRQQIEDSEDFREVVRKLQKVMNSRGGIQEVQKKYVNSLAGELVEKWTPQGLSRKTLAENLTTAFDTMANAKTTREAEIAMQAMADIAQDLIERSVEVVDQAGEGSMKGKINGQYIRGTNRIQVALDSDQGLLTATLAHEMTHFIKAWNLEGYVDLANFIGSKLGQTDGYNLQERIEQKIEQYKQSGVELTEEGAVEEIVADSMFKVFENEQYVHDLFEQHESLGKKIASRLKNFVQELKQLAKNLKSPEARAMAKQEAETVDKMAEMFNQAAQVAMAQRYNQTMQETQEQKGQEEAQYLLKNENGNIVRPTKREIKDNKKTVANMDAVAKIEGNRFATGIKGELVSDIDAYFEEIGRVVRNKVLGDVHLNKSGAKHFVAQKATKRRRVMVEAIKAVLEKGKLVYIDNKHKGNGFDTAIIAAPVDVQEIVDVQGDESESKWVRYYAGVVVKQTSVGYTSYYFHDAITEEEANKKEGTDSFQQESGHKATSRESVPSVSGILKSIIKYNRQNGQNAFSQKENAELNRYRYSLKEDTGVLASLQGVDKINENMRQQIEDSEDFREVVRKLQKVMNSRGGIQEVQKKYVNSLAGELVEKWTPQGLSRKTLTIRNFKQKVEKVLALNQNLW